MRKGTEGRSSEDVCNDDNITSFVDNSNCQHSYRRHKGVIRSNLSPRGIVPIQQIFRQALYHWCIRQKHGKRSISPSYGIRKTKMRLDDRVLMKLQSNDTSIKAIRLNFVNDEDADNVTLDGDIDARKVANALKRNTTLKYLDLSENRIGDEGAIAISEALKENISLTGLKLASNRISSDGAKAIADMLTVNKSLRRLWLNSNNIGSSGAKALASALKRNKSIYDLDLRWDAIGDEGCFAIADMMKVNCSVKILRLDYNFISDNSAKVILKALEDYNDTITACLEVDANYMVAYNTKRWIKNIAIANLLHVRKVPEKKAERRRHSTYDWLYNYWTDMKPVKSTKMIKFDDIDEKKKRAIVYVGSYPFNKKSEHDGKEFGDPCGNNYRCTIHIY